MNKKIVRYLSFICNKHFFLKERFGIQCVSMEFSLNAQCIQALIYVICSKRVLLNTLFHIRSH